MNALALFYLLLLGLTLYARRRPLLCCAVAVGAAAALVWALALGLGPGRLVPFCLVPALLLAEKGGRE